MRLTTREQITPSVQPRPHSQTSLLRILAMPNRCCKFATIYCARSLEIPFLPQAHRSDLEADCPCHCGQKNEPRCGIDTRARGSGHGYYLLLRKVLLKENRKIPRPH